MDGLMQDVVLGVETLFERAERYHHRKAVVSVTSTGTNRTTYGQWAQRTRRLGTVLDTLGISSDARVGTFAWNSARHLEIYFAVPCSARVLHAVNIRLFPEQIAYVIDHAGDEALFVDRSLLPVLYPLLGGLHGLRHLIVMDDGHGVVTGEDGRLLWDGAGPLPSPRAGLAVHDYETLLAGAEPCRWPGIDDERRAAAMCYTSGTTGHPKGVVYSHRSTYLHATSIMQADSMAVCERDVILPAVPMFHVNAWSLAHAAVATGASLVMPGQDLSGRAVADLVVNERVTFAAGVPTIWLGALEHLEGRDTSALRIVLSGGSAVPKSLSEAYRQRVGVPILHAWGMTETSAAVSIGRLTTAFDDADEDTRADQRASVGPVCVGVRCRIVEPGTANELAWDGKSPGELQVRAAWVANAYYGDTAPSSDEHGTSDGHGPSDAGAAFTDDGWLRTGDVATVDAYGYLRLVDRTKDLIKSGGEWISSVELENELMAHPDIVEAAVVAMPDERWGERPLACVVVRSGADLDVEGVLGWLRPRVAKWQLPDRVEFIDEVPKTSVGKFSKKDLRARFGPGH